MTRFLLPETSWPSSLPELHRQFLRTAIATLSQDRRIVGLAAGGSFRTDSLDAFSDLDLVVLVHPDSWPGVLEQREDIIRPLGALLAAFTGEHVGEPRLTIALYGPPLLHVDFKFIRPEDLATRVEDPVVLWDRDGVISAVLAQSTARYPAPDPQWIEDRFWVWVHYFATKVGRGELFEALEGLAFLRGRVLGPLLLLQAGQTPNGVRRLESIASEQVAALRQTTARYDRDAIIGAIRVTVDLYQQVRPSGVVRRDEAEAAAMAYLHAVA